MYVFERSEKGMKYKMNLLFIIIGIVLIIYILKSVMNKNFDMYESIFWIIAVFGIIILAIFPKSLDEISLKLGISYSPSLVFLLGVVFLLFINFKQSRLLNDEKQKTTELAQQLAIIKQKIEEMENKDDKR